MHRTSIQVRWGELDPYNHVNHAVYSSYLEHARIAALAAVDSGMDSLTASGFQIVVTRSDVHFRAPATAGDDLVITTQIEEVKGARIAWKQTIDRGDDRIVDARIHAAFLAATGRPARIPQDLHQALTSLE